VLAARGYRVVTAATGHEGLSMIERKMTAIDLLLTDGILPGPSRRRARRAGVAVAAGLPVLYMSATRVNVVLQAGAQHGMHYLEEPFSSEL